MMSVKDIYNHPLCKPALLLVVLALLVFAFKKNDEQLRLEIQSLQDSVAKNKVAISRVESEVTELAKQDTLLMDSIAQSKGRITVIKQILANPQVQPFTDDIKSKAFLLDKFTKHK